MNLWFLELEENLNSGSNWLRRTQTAIRSYSLRKQSDFNHLGLPVIVQEISLIQGINKVLRKGSSLMVSPSINDIWFCLFRPILHEIVKSIISILDAFIRFSEQSWYAKKQHSGHSRHANCTVDHRLRSTTDSTPFSYSGINKRIIKRGLNTHLLYRLHDIPLHTQNESQYL